MLNRDAIVGSMRLLYLLVLLAPLARADQPVAGAQLTVSADMPSMPGEHRLKPVKARPGKGPGEYLVRLDLDMPGEWDLTLRLTGAVRDRLLLHCEFDQRGG